MGLHLGKLCREVDFLMKPGACDRFLYGRLVQEPCCLALLQKGCCIAAPEIRLIAPDESTAATGVMRQIKNFPRASVAQFAQAVGAIYYAAQP